MITLKYDRYAVQLRSPEFGDSIGLRLDTIIRRSMNKTPYSFTNPVEGRTRDFSFKQLSRVEVRNYFNFIAASRGKNIMLIDHDNLKWQGSITSTPASSSHNGINNSDLAFTFEGVQVA